MMYTCQVDGMKEMTLRVLKRNIDKNITDVVGKYDTSTIFRYNEDINEWEKIQIQGTLFLCMLEDKRLMIVILNNKSYFDPMNYVQKLPIDFSVAKDGNKVYMKFKEIMNICVSMNSEKDANQFIDILSSLVAEIKQTEPLVNDLDFTRYGWTQANEFKDPLWNHIQHTMDRYYSQQ